MHLCILFLFFFCLVINKAVASNFIVLSERSLINLFLSLYFTKNTPRKVTYCSVMSINETIYNNSVFNSPPCLHRLLNLAGSDIIGVLIGKFKLELKMEILSETSHGIYY